MKTAALVAGLGIAVVSGCETAYLDAVARGSCGPSSGEPAHRARAFTESLGAQVHLAWPDTAFADYPRLVSDLQALGIRHVRDGAQGAAGKPAPYRDLAKHGLAVLLQLHVDSDPRALADEVGPALEAVQVPTPGDGSSGYPAPESVPERTRAVAAALARLPLASRPGIVGAALGEPRTEPTGELAGQVDFGAATYPGGNPSAAGGDRLARAARWYPGRPAMATGGPGYSTISGGGEPLVTETVHAKYVLRLFLEQFARGFARTYYFRLYDTSETHGEGLAGADARPRLAYHAVAALTSLLLDREGGGRAASLPLTVQASAGGPAPRRLLFQKTDGTYVLVLWVPAASTDEDVTTTVRLGFGVPVRKLVTHDLRTRASTAVTSATGAFELSVSDFPTVVTIAPACD